MFIHSLINSFIKSPLTPLLQRGGFNPGQSHKGKWLVIPAFPSGMTIIFHARSQNHRFMRFPRGFNELGVVSC